VRIFRTLSTGRLIVLVVAVVAVVVGGTVAVAARGGSAATPPPKALDQAIHDALTAPQPDGITARISFTNNLLPSGALTGQAGSALVTGATGRLWVNAGGGRLELQSDAGDTQITWNDSKLTVYDASSNTAYVAALPTRSDNGATTQVPSLEQISSFLTEAAKDWTISTAQPSNVAGEQAYTVAVSPAHGGGLLGSVQLAWDALRGVPLRIAVYAQGSSSPVLQLEATDISFGSVSNSDIQIAPPAGTKIVDVSGPRNDNGTGTSPPVTGLAAVQAAAPFTVVAPDTLAGRPRGNVQMIGGKTVLVVYGQGLDAIVVVERPVESGNGPGALSSLPTVAVGASTAHELATALGTAVEWSDGGVSYLVAGSVPAAEADAAARALR
jgi:outer membrane lipoprotein-sorting protein